MYVQITSRCNMSCAHCGMNANMHGMDMTRKVWKASIKLALAHTGMITLGGGEPTLHKNFWEMLGIALGSGFESIWLATNGSKTETALALANLAQKGVIGCALSQDSYHDPIDERVIEAFTREQKSKWDGNDYREIRNVDGKEIKAGRCNFGEEECICEDVFIQPDGTIKGCGCADAITLGTVFNPEIPQEWEHGVCTKKQGLDLEVC